MRRVAWFSCGAASAVAAKLANPDVIAYCDTGAEHKDNGRFLGDCEKWFGQEVIILKSEEYQDTWDVWEKRKYIAGIAGAPCTGILKREVREKFQRPDDVHIFGYTLEEQSRADLFTSNWPELSVEFPLIERSLNKQAALQMVLNAGIAIPLVYDLGFEHANCIPCPKATSPDYWALVRKEFPDEFSRMVELSRRLGARLTRVKGKRVFIDEIPEDWPTRQPMQPACDFLCEIAEQEFS
jgi:hypothetical protein